MLKSGSYRLLWNQNELAAGIWCCFKYCDDPGTGSDKIKTAGVKPTVSYSWW